MITDRPSGGPRIVSLSFFLRSRLCRRLVPRVFAGSTLLTVAGDWPEGQGGGGVAEWVAVQKLAQKAKTGLSR